MSSRSGRIRQFGRSAWPLSAIGGGVLLVWLLLCGTGQGQPVSKQEGKASKSPQERRVRLVGPGAGIAIQVAPEAVAAPAVSPSPSPPVTPLEPTPNWVRQRYLRLQLELRRPAPPERTPRPQPRIVTEDGQIVEPPEQPVPRDEADALAGRLPLPRFGAEFFEGGWQPPTAGTAVRSVPSSYVLGLGDRLQVIRTSPTPSERTSTIGPDGTIGLGDAGRVVLSGLTLAEARQAIVRQMSRSYANPKVEVILTGLKTVGVSVVGNVMNPGIYAATGLSSVLELLHLAGGPTENGSLRQVRLFRNGKPLAQIDLYDLLDKGVLSQEVIFQAGDVIALPARGAVVGARGAFRRPAAYELTDKQANLAGLLELAQGLRSDALTTRLTLRRHGAQGIAITEWAFKDGADLQAKARTYKLQDGDEVEAHAARPVQRNWVAICGNVWQPGDYALRPGMRVKDLIDAAGGLMPATVMDRAELWHFVAEDRQAVTPIDLEAAISGAEEHNRQLHEWDILEVHVQRGPSVVWRPGENNGDPEKGGRKAIEVSIRGRVHRPGRYIVPAGTTVAELIDRAGLKKDAYPPGAVYIKQPLVKEQEKLDAALQELRNPATEELEKLLAGSQVDFEQGVRYRRALDLRRREKALAEAMLPNGRFAIDLEKHADLVLEHGDEIFIPHRPTHVTGVGAINHPTSVLYEAGKDWRYYVKRMGGLRAEADLAHAYVIQPNGYADPIGGDGRTEPAAGAVIVVPELFDRTLWARLKGYDINATSAAGEVQNRPPAPDRQPKAGRP